MPNLTEVEAVLGVIWKKVAKGHLQYFAKVCQVKPVDNFSLPLMRMSSLTLF